MTVPRRLLSPVDDVVGRGEIGDGHSRPLSRIDAELRTTATDLGVDLVWPPMLVVGVFMAGVWLAGVSIGGWAGGVGATLALGAGAAAAKGLARRRRSVREQEALPEVCLHMTRTLRSGKPIDHALQDVTDQVAPVSRSLLAVAQQLDAGRPLMATLEDWVLASESSAERVLSAALTVGTKRGGDLASALDVIGDGIRDDLELAARRRVLLVQATMSATVLVLLPIVFAGLASIVRGGVVFEGRIGLVLVTAGLTLDGVGCVWMRRLMRGLR